MSLEARILDYIDEMAPPVSADEAIAPRRSPNRSLSRSQTRRWGWMVPAWAYGLGALILVLVGALGMNLLLAEDQDPVVEPTPTTVLVPAPTTVPPDVETMTDLAVIEAGVDAFYSGEAERAAELFELADRTDDQIRAESAYQAAMGGRLDLSCTETSAGEFNCSTLYHNAMTDAIGVDGGQDVWPVVVEDGVITQFGFSEHTGLLIGMATFLASEGRFDGYEDCISGPFPEWCATIQVENLDAWAEWHETSEPADRVETMVESWYGGDCEAVAVMSWGETDCSASSLPAQTMAYESILGAQVSLENCATTSGGDNTGLSCEVHYSNAMNSAVGKPPSVTAREFVFRNNRSGFLVGPDGEPWYQADYPEDTELRASFRVFAEGGELADEYAGAGCASLRSPECAKLIVDNFDAWATWYEING